MAAPEMLEPLLPFPADQARPVPADQAMAEIPLVSGSDQHVLVITDCRGTIVFANTRRMFGCDDRALVDQPIAALVPGLRLRETTPGFNVAYVRFHFAAAPWESHQAKTADGRLIPVDVSLRVLALERGYGLLAMMRRHHAPRSDQRGITELCEAAETCSRAVFVTDTRGIIEYANPVFENISGYGHGEAVGRPAAMLKSGVHKRRFFDELWSTVRAGDEFCAVFVNRAKNGQHYREEKTIRPFVNDDGSITHFVSTGREVGRSVAVPNYGTGDASANDENVGELRAAGTAMPAEVPGLRSVLPRADIDPFQSPCGEPSRE